MITLSDLAFACFVYGRLSNYDESYLRFLRITDHTPDLGDSTHRKALLEWLNQWGCRQFGVKYHDRASEEVLAWQKAYGSSLFPRDRNLRELTEAELGSVGPAYESLCSRIASYRTRNGSTYPVSVGPTGAAKILFAIRPHALPPWDDAIRKAVRRDDAEASYVWFVRHVKSVVEQLARLCETEGFGLRDLPTQIGRPASTLPKVIDEYYWVTITRGCSPPQGERLQRWARWSRS